MDHLEKTLTGYSSGEIILFVAKSGVGKSEYKE